MLYDTHAHLDDKKLYPEISEVLDRAAASGVGLINTIGCDWKSSLMAVHIAERYSRPDLQIYAAVGFHPSDSAGMDEAMLERLFELAQADKCVAWGEIGLDYYWPTPDRDHQRWAFTAQIDSAKQVGKPIVIHDRDAHNDVLDILKRHKAGVNGGVLHCCSCSWEVAKECLRLGFYISFAGPLTFKNARVALEVAAKTPLDRLLVETDCPYLAPEPNRGKRNEPAYVAFTAARLAEIRGLSADEMAAICTENGKTLFRI